MKREIMITGDGSKTIHMPDLNEQYHSKHGALQEAFHVFIETGLRHVWSVKKDASPISIMEFGFGTGLNALLTAQFEADLTIEYTGIEAYPITVEEVQAMEYGSYLNDPILFEKLHNCEWDRWNEITDGFKLLKLKNTFEKIEGSVDQDLIFYDAFGPRTQPELWTQEIFEICNGCLKKGGVLTTYCAQGQARRNMIAAGFEVERLPGPPGKREMLRATKI